jgi:hypothetical protein
MRTGSLAWLGSLAVLFPVSETRGEPPLSAPALSLLDISNREAGESGLWRSAPMRHSRQNSVGSRAEMALNRR